MNQTFEMSYSSELGAYILDSSELGNPYILDDSAYNALNRIPTPPPPPGYGRGSGSGAGIAQTLAYPNYTYQPPGNVYVTNTQTPTRTTSIKLNDILQNGVGIASQIISAFGKNPNQQILTGSGAIVPVAAQLPQTNNYGNAGISTEAQAAYAAQQQALARNGGVGESAIDTGKGFLDGIAGSFGISTTMLLVGAGVGWYLLQKEPKKRR